MIRHGAIDQEMIMDDGHTIAADAAGTVASVAKVFDFGVNWKRKGLVTLYIKCGENGANAYVAYNLRLEFAASSGGFATRTGLSETKINNTDHFDGKIYSLTTEVKDRYARFYTDVVGGVGSLPVYAYLGDQFNR